MERRPVIVLAVAVLLSIPIMPLELWLIQELIDRIQTWTTSDSIRSIMMAAAWLAGLMVLNNIVLGVPIPMAMTRLNEIGVMEGQRLILHKTARLPMAAIEAPETKDLRERAMNISLDDLYNNGLHLLQTALQCFLLLVVMLLYGQWLPVLVFCMAVLLLLKVSGQSAVRLETLAREQTESRRTLRHYVGLMTKRESSKEVRLFGLGSLFKERWTSLYVTQSNASWKTVQSAEVRRLGPELGLAIGSGLILALIVLMPASASLSAGEFALLFLAATKLLSMLPAMMEQGIAMRKQVMRWEDYRVYLKLEETADCERLALDEQVPNREYVDDSHAGLRLEVGPLRFRYPGAARDALNGISLTIPIGCRAALVGENGSGKSTLVKLLTGLYTPDEGEVVWSDGTGRRLSGTWEEHWVSAVFQDFTRLYLTLRENVALGRLHAFDHDKALHKALQSAGAGSKFTDLNTQLGASFGGVEPSGGEWQKIATARALIREAGFVFFDEPTAALDPQAEKQAFELFLRVTERRSALLVTHRLGAAKLADLIFVLKDGALVEQGTHEELMQTNGEYSRMFRLQAAWYA